MKYSKIFIPILISIGIYLFFILFYSNFNISNYENINHFYKNIKTESNLILILSYISVLPILVGFLSFYIKKHINFMFFSIVYLISSLSVVSSFIYIRLSRHQEPYTFLCLFYIFLLFATFLIVNRFIKYKNKKIASSIFFGKRLEDYIKMPWLYNNKYSKAKYVFVYFEISRFNQIQDKINNLKEIDHYFNQISKIYLNTLDKYNGILINKNETSGLYAIKKEKYPNMVFKNDVDYAYFAILSSIYLQNEINNFKIDNPLIDNLKVNICITNTSARTITQISKNILKMTFVTDAYNNISKLIELNQKSGSILIDQNTYSLVSSYFTCKNINNSYEILGISTY